MSKLNGALYSSDDHTWQTPPSITDPILKFENRETFTIDPCCMDTHIPALFHIMYPDDCGIKADWDQLQDENIAFVNPPNGRTEQPCAHKKNCKKKKCKERGYCIDKPRYGVDAFLKKAYHEWVCNNVKSWVLLPARTETDYQNDFGLSKAGFTVFLTERISFWKNGEPFLQLDKKSGKMKPGSSPFPPMLLYYGDDWREKLERWMKEKPLKGTPMINPWSWLRRESDVEK